MKLLVSLVALVGSALLLSPMAEAAMTDKGVIPRSLGGDYDGYDEVDNEYYSGCSWEKKSAEVCRDDDYEELTLECDGSNEDLICYVAGIEDDKDDDEIWCKEYDSKVKCVFKLEDDRRNRELGGDDSQQQQHLRKLGGCTHVQINALCC